MRAVFASVLNSIIPTYLFNFSACLVSMLLQKNLLKSSSGTESRSTYRLGNKM